VRSLTSVHRTQFVRKLPALLYLIARYYAAFTLLGYGFAKVMGAQFTILDSELAKPMGDVSGFWLTWYYFSYSAVYASVVAWVQIVGAALLGFRRTALVGVLLLLPVMVNIVCIDLWVVKFPLESGALRNAFFALFALLVVLSFMPPTSADSFSRREMTWRCSTTAVHGQELLLPSSYLR
jgi:uncharacterized membrane protein YphA (DoxX/SURF4 family)